MTTPTRTLASVEATAEHFGVAPARIRELIRQGKIPAFRLGPRLVRVDLQAAEEAVQIATD